ncbi:DUF2069 domain-containing protein [Methylophaga sp. OBS4]|uniref:DUF2069 domain-containing protein n=1 Tax=Methylophaga sp. OBS4 TaxID=2991935 RepID=UPI00224EF430|nr:DUF2069 domain-containing protein [Methylophaga sp. OBS4]MCX4188218.1 DUF2069 domain-containing protein [Methylophaga sp. OBS4]
MRRQQTLVTIFRQMTLVGFFGLMLTLLAWILIAPHSAAYPTAAMLIIGVVPLLFPLRGLLYARPYTHAWTSFLMLFYFSHSVGELYSTESFSIYPLLALIFSSLCFVSAIIFVKTQAKMRKKSQKET